MTWGPSNIPSVDVNVGDRVEIYGRYLSSPICAASLAAEPSGIRKLSTQPQLPKVDVYTDRGGRGPNVPSGTYLVGDQFPIYVDLSMDAMVTLSVSYSDGRVERFDPTQTNAGTHDVTFIAEEKDVGTVTVQVNACSSSGECASDTTWFEVRSGAVTVTVTVTITSTRTQTERVERTVTQTRTITETRTIDAAVQRTVTANAVTITRTETGSITSTVYAPTVTATVTAQVTSYPAPWLVLSTLGVIGTLFQLPRFRRVGIFCRRVASLFRQFGLLTWLAGHHPKKALISLCLITVIVLSMSVGADQAIAGAFTTTKTVTITEWTTLTESLTETQYFTSTMTETSLFTRTNTGFITVTPTVTVTVGQETTVLTYVPTTVTRTQTAATAPKDNAQISEFQPPTGSSNPGDSLKTTVVVVNTGTTTRTFWVGLSYQKPDGSYYDVPPQQTNVLSPHENQLLTFRWNLPQDAPGGQYNAVVAIWNGYDSQNNRMVEPKFDEKRAESISVSSLPSKSNGYSAESDGFLFFNSQFTASAGQTPYSTKDEIKRSLSRFDVPSVFLDILAWYLVDLNKRVADSQGYCFGMSEASIDYFNSGIHAYSAFGSDMNKPLDDIRHDQITQNLDLSFDLKLFLIDHGLTSNQAELQLIQQHISPSHPAIIVLGNSQTGHAVVGYSVELLGDQTVITAYDPNEGHHPVQIVIGSDGSFSYDGYDDLGFFEPPIDYMSKILDFVERHSSVGFGVHSPVDLAVTDESGRYVGVKDGIFSQGFPALYISNGEEKAVIITDHFSNNYRVILTGIGSGSYILETFSYVNSQSTQESLHDTVSQGQTIEYDAVLQSSGSVAVTKSSENSVSYGLVAQLSSATPYFIILAICLVVLAYSRGMRKKREGAAKQLGPRVKEIRSTASDPRVKSIQEMERTPRVLKVGDE